MKVGNVSSLPHQCPTKVIDRLISYASVLEQLQQRFRCTHGLSPQKFLEQLRDDNYHIREYEQEVDPKIVNLEVASKLREQGILSDRTVNQIRKEQRRSNVPKAHLLPSVYATKKHMYESGRSTAACSLNKFIAKDDQVMNRFRLGGLKAVVERLFENPSALERMIQNNKELSASSREKPIVFDTRHGCDGAKHGGKVSMINLSCTAMDMGSRVHAPACNLDSVKYVGSESSSEIWQKLRPHYYEIEQHRKKTLEIAIGGEKYYIKMFPLYIADLHFLYKAFGVTSWSSNNHFSLWCSCTRTSKPEATGSGLPSGPSGLT